MIRPLGAAHPEGAGDLTIPDPSISTDRLIGGTGSGLAAPTCMPPRTRAADGSFGDSQWNTATRQIEKTGTVLVAFEAQPLEAKPPANHTRQH